MMHRRRWLWIILGIVTATALAPSYIRAYRLDGVSAAPSYLLGDLIIVNKAAYDIRLPYTGIVLLSHAQPKRGDVVWFKRSRTGPYVFKRVIGEPGDTIAMLENHLTINGTPLRYLPVARGAYDNVADANGLGTLIEQEIGCGPDHLISYTPGAGSQASVGPAVVPDGHLYLMGDNRDESLDSRMYGPLDRRYILGKVGRPHR
ncbi:MAG: signal peptidase I [Gemmatimonadales bacterium]|nr:signal peptidase I [Gemmatimonadales bacterium]NIN13158.1 signal peptidase I [Gemmatimonadales bacterium]NIN51436.1 signal peptidase I [Gemmatimonadales bacterium]NIP08900.1 signal peptidase I [Gemmatimonadales bacterium]NIR03688.1 signal peptidase I [Gemmatimonadales bacterium]